MHDLLREEHEFFDKGMDAINGTTPEERHTKREAWYKNGPTSRQARIKLNYEPLLLFKGRKS